MNTGSSESPWRKSTYSSGAQTQCVEVATWRKSTHSTGAQSQCVEVATDGVVLIRDTTDRDGGTLSVSASAWSRFISSIK
jgi:hypothetical protein